MSERYLVISGDKEEINQLLTDIWARAGEMPVGALEIEGVFYKSVVWCDCPRKQREDMKNWVKAKQWGIPICRSCRRPSRFWVEGVMKRLTLALGNSELDS